MEVLIVEKSIDMAQKLSYLLLPLGIKGIVVTNRQDGWQKLEQKPEIRIGIIDVDNKSVAGSDLIDDIYQTQGNHFRFIIYSAAEMDQLASRLIDKNIIGYIQKPFEPARVDSSLKIIFSSINFPELDKREHLRVRPAKDEMMRVNFRLTTPATLICGRIVNLSLAGIAVELFNSATAALLREKTQIPLLEFQVDYKSVTTAGTVILKRGNIVAIRLQALSQEARNVLARYIFKRLVP